MFVLSPSVEATKASASAIPARSRTEVSMPWPRWNSPGQFGPSRPSASSLSSMTTTSQPSDRSRAATADPTLPTPTMRAFTGGTLFLENPLRIRHDHHLAGSAAQHVVHRRTEEARLPAPAWRGAHEDEVDAVAARLVDDRLADRPAAHDLALHLDAVLGGEELRLGERRLGLLLLVRQLRVERKLERHLDHVERAHRAAALLSEADGGREHLLADLAELHGHENPFVDPLLLRNEVGDRGLDVLHERLVTSLAHGDEEDRSEDEPDRPGDPRGAVGVERGEPERERERRAHEGGNGNGHAPDADVAGDAVGPGEVGLREPQADHRELRG